MMSDETRQDSWATTINHLFELFFTPEIERRKEAGTLDDTFALRYAQVLMYSDGRQHEVRLNDEVAAILRVQAKEPIAAGDPVYSSQIGNVVGMELPDDVDPNAAHATVARIGDAWYLGFDFRYNKALSQQHVETANEFLSAAHTAMESEHWRAFLDNLFSAAELLSKAVLLLLPDADFVKKTSHRSVHARINRFAHLGNIAPEFRDTFNRLSQLRSPARYLEREVQLLPEEAASMYSIVDHMATEAAARCSARVTDYEGDA